MSVDHMKEQLALDTPDTWIRSTQLISAMEKSPSFSPVGSSKRSLPMTNSAAPKVSGTSSHPRQRHSARVRRRGLSVPHTACECSTRKFLGHLEVCPSTNQIRKVVHDRSVRLCAGEEKARDIMELLDKHSGKTIKKHYQFFSAEIGGSGQRVDTARHRREDSQLVRGMPGDGCRRFGSAVGRNYRCR